jgi:hypothetical protein
MWYQEETGKPVSFYAKFGEVLRRYELMQETGGGDLASPVCSDSFFVAVYLQR